MVVMQTSQLGKNVHRDVEAAARAGDQWLREFIRGDHQAEAKDLLGLSGKVCGSYLLQKLTGGGPGCHHPGCSRHVWPEEWVMVAKSTLQKGWDCPRDPVKNKLQRAVASLQLSRKCSNPTVVGLVAVRALKKAMPSAKEVEEGYLCLPCTKGDREPAYIATKLGDGLGLGKESFPDHIGGAPQQLLGVWAAPSLGEAKLEARVLGTETAKKTRAAREESTKALQDVDSLSRDLQKKVQASQKAVAVAEAARQKAEDRVAELLAALEVKEEELRRRASESKEALLEQELATQRALVSSLVVASALQTREAKQKEAALITERTAADKRAVDLRQQLTAIEKDNGILASQKRALESELEDAGAATMMGAAADLQAQAYTAAQPYSPPQMVTDEAVDHSAVGASCGQQYIAQVPHPLQSDAAPTHLQPAPMMPPQCLGGGPFRYCEQLLAVVHVNLAFLPAATGDLEAVRRAKTSLSTFEEHLRAAASDAATLSPSV